MAEPASGRKHPGREVAIAPVAHHKDDGGVLLAFARSAGLPSSAGGRDAREDAFLTGQAAAHVSASSWLTYTSSSTAAGRKSWADIPCGHLRMPGMREPSWGWAR